MVTIIKLLPTINIGNGIKNYPQYWLAWEILNFSIERSFD